MKKIVIPAAAVTVALLASCSYANSGPDEYSLGYDAGPMQSTAFDGCYNPGTREYDGPNDEHYNYPAKDRTYKFGGDGRDLDGPAIKAVSKDNVEMSVSGVVIFTMTYNCDSKVSETDERTTLQAFHEDIGLKYRNQYPENWWMQLMDTYVGKPIDRAVDRAAQSYGWLELYNNPTTKAAFEASILKQLPTILQQQVGSGYFSIKSISVQKPEPPDTLKQALQNKERAIQDNAAQSELNAKVKTELQSIKELVEVLGPQGYILYQAIKDGKITVVPVPTGGNVVVQP